MENENTLQVESSPTPLHTHTNSKAEINLA